MCKPVTFQSPLSKMPQPPAKDTKGIGKIVQPIIEDLPFTTPSSPLSSRTVSPEICEEEGENRVDQVVQPMIKDLPSSPNSRRAPPEIPVEYDQVMFYIQTDATPKTPIDIDWIKSKMALAGTQSQSGASLAHIHYLEVIQHINSSVLDLRGMLVDVFCNLIIAHNLDQNLKRNLFIERAADRLELLSQWLWKPNCTAKRNPTFMHLVGVAQLMLHQNSTDPDMYRRTKNYFFTAPRLIDESSLPADNPIRQKKFWGLSLAHLYEVRRYILNEGIARKRDRLIEMLDLSRQFLKNSLEGHSSNILQYQQALTHCLTTVLLEVQQSEEKTAEANKLYKKSEGHLKQAEKLLNAITPKTGIIHALLGIIKYKNAFDHERVDYSLGWQAIQDLSEADSLLGGKDPSLRLAITDTLRQIAWVLPVDYMRYRFECSLEKLSEETGDYKLVAESCRLVFNTQTALWQLMEYIKILSDLQRQSEAAQDLGKIEIEDVNIVLLINLGIVRRDTLNTLRKKSHPDRLKNVGKDLRLLKDFTDTALLDLAELDFLLRSNFIREDVYKELKNNALQDLRVIEVLKKVSLKLLKDNSFQNLSKCSAQLAQLLVKSKDAPRYAPVWHLLKRGQYKLEKKYLILTILPENPQERREYMNLIQKIGSVFDDCYTESLFKEMLLERLKNYDYVLDPELHMV